VIHNEMIDYMYAITHIIPQYYKKQTQ